MDDRIDVGGHILEINSMFFDERNKVREHYKEYDGC